MIIPEVFLPWGSPPQTTTTADDSADGYKGRVTLEFLGLLQVNAKQMQTYLKTYIKHSEDFPSDVYMDLQNKFADAQRLHSDVRSQSGASQKDLSAIASEYVDYMREVKTMCHDVWAKFDNFHINQGSLLFSLVVLLTLLSLFDPDFSVASLGKCFRISFFLGVPVSLVSLVVSPLPLEFGMTSILDVTLSLSFYPLLLYTLFHSLILGHHMYTILKEGSVFVWIFSLLNQVSFTYVLGVIVVISYSVSLTSNSFILYEGDMTAFFLQSMLICLIVQRMQALSGEYAPVISPSSSGNRNNEVKTFSKKSNFSLMLALSEVWPLVLAMAVVRLTKAFHACRDLQVGCEATSFIQPYHGAVETLGGLAGLRLVFSCLGVLSVPLGLAWWVRSSGLGLLQLLCVNVGLPLSSLCVCGFWVIQSLPQPTLDSLPHWQHVTLPRIVYFISIFTIGVSIMALLRKTHSETDSSSIDSGGLSQLSGNGRRLDSEISTVRQRLTTAATAKNTLPDNGLEKVDEKNEETAESVADSGSHLVMAPLLVAVWLPVAMVLNDGVALSAVLLVLQVSLILSGLLHTQGQSVGSIPHYELSKPCLTCKNLNLTTSHKFWIISNS